METLAGLRQPVEKIPHMGRGILEVSIDSPFNVTPLCPF